MPHCESYGICMKDIHSWQKQWDGKSWLCMCSCNECMKETEIDK